ncbi:bifunctional folylpolyglutamate synthase/dihydrofolate synthase [Halalkalibacter krulwichiae]|uniref:Dihydrofolate synthase/folylpolyglutamate synthase n=1 Tax=Halalkalibacter krulwichiae TaxID=199441 RepID=A0A1X9MDU9_9BACI|nr:folylpolyglutamate synthase/dihydrofolate synthase family protein [Halalkalibacter krulwichiae]ARK31608.1 Folylpolyglutamate synthase [Halalkalibacter krulwichiae]
MKNRADVINWIEGLLSFGIKPGLERMNWMLDRLDRPDQMLKAIHIGGTNGKGSTVSFLRHTLVEAGYSVGTFTSPSMECFEDRISLNGTPINEEALLTCAKRIQPLVEQLSKTEYGSPTEFEVLTTIAFDYFGTIAKPDIVLVEVGLGGRLDSTNVITPILSIITSIGFDHMQILGESLKEIASEKAGIIKEHVPIVSGVSQEDAKRVIQAVSNQNKSPLYVLGKHFDEEVVAVNEERQVFTYTQIGREPLDVTIQMSGPHQRQNAAIAIQALELLRTNNQLVIDDTHIQKGLLLTTWPGRFEVLQESPTVIVDGAHNKEGMQALAETLKLHYPNKNVRFLIAATKEKDMNSLLQPFLDFQASFTFTTFDFDRAAKAESLSTQAPVQTKRYHENWTQALHEEIEQTKMDEVLIICGSLYFIARVREKWKNLISVM